MFFIYILYSKSIDKFYTGQTYNLNIRLLRHKLKTSQFTKRADDWELLYSEKFKTRQKAINREKEIKNKKSRLYLVKLIGKSTG